MRCKGKTIFEICKGVFLRKIQDKVKSRVRCMLLNISALCQFCGHFGKMAFFGFRQMSVRQYVTNYKYLYLITNNS